MTSRLHAATATLAMLCILGFWLSTTISELFLSHAAILGAKTTILHAMWIFIPAIAATGASGFALARGRTAPLLVRKRRRMAVIAINGLAILLPAAIYLHAKAFAGDFDARFYAIQSAELLAGAINLALMYCNFRDGLKLAGRLRRRVQAPGEFRQAQQ